MRKLVQLIVESLVDEPDKILVTAIEGSQSSVIKVSVAKGDLGKVIGKNGRTANAIRDILNAASAKVKKRAVLEIEE